MGKYPRVRQRHLPEKLLQIRAALNLSQNEMLRHLELDERLNRTNISNYELGDREPPLYVLLRYARAAGICVDVLIDDELELPTKIPSTPLHAGVLSKPVSKKSGKS